MAPDDLNDKVREHETNTEWYAREAAETLHAFFDRLNAVFFEGRLPQCFLSFARSRRSRLGHFQPGHNSVGARYEININALHLNGPPAEPIATLLHEMAHLWQELYGRPGRGTYHNAEFTHKCRTLGLFTEPGTGCHLGYGDPFLSFLDEHGVDTAPLTQAREMGECPRSSGLLHSSKLKKWSCACTNVRCAVPLDAQCLRCGMRFRRAV